MKSVFALQHGRSQANNSIFYIIDNKSIGKNKIIQIFKIKLLIKTTTIFYYVYNENFSCTKVRYIGTNIALWVDH